MKNCRAKLIDLLGDHARSTESAPPADLPAEGPLLLVAEWKRADFEIRHGGAEADDLLVRCRLGALPASTSVPAMRRLLEIQADLTRDARALLSLDPLTNEACLTQALSLETATPDEFAFTLHAMSQRAEEWRASQFLSADLQVASAT